MVEVFIVSSLEKVVLNFTSRGFSAHFEKSCQQEFPAGLFGIFKMKNINAVKKSNARVVSNAKKMTPQCDNRLLRAEGGWAPLGFDDEGNSVFFSWKTGRCYVMGPKQGDPATLRARLGSDYCDQFDREHAACVEEGDTDSTGLANTIQKACEGMGKVNLAKARFPGLYLEDGQLIVNTGTEVSTSTGKPIDVTPSKNVMYVGGKDLGFTLQTPLASEEEIQHLVETIKSFKFRSHFEEVAVLGWFVTAFFGSVLKYRPTLAISAERGSGKTTLLQLIGQLLDSQSIPRNGMPTEAQVIYALETGPAVMLLDEIESHGYRKIDWENLQKTLRNSFTRSDVEGTARVVGGKIRHFFDPSGSCIAGISLPRFTNDANNTRTIGIQMMPLPVGERRAKNPWLEFENVSEVKEVGARLRRTLVARWSVMRETVSAFRDDLCNAGHEPRAADRLAPVLAGYVALLSDKKPSRKERLELLAACGLKAKNVVVIERDCDTCWQVILGARVNMTRVIEGKTVRVPMRVREVLVKVANARTSDEERRSLITQIQQYGIRPLWDKGANQWNLLVCSSEFNKGVRSLLAKTNWANGGWKDLLSRLPNATRSTQRVDGLAEKVVVVPLADDVLTQAVEEFDLPAQEDYLLAA